MPERTVVSLDSEKITVSSIPWNTVQISGWTATALYDYVRHGVKTSYNLPHNNVSACIAAYVWKRTA